MDSETRLAQDARRTPHLGGDAQSLRPQNSRGSTVTELVEHLEALGAHPVLEHQGSEEDVQGISWILARFVLQTYMLLFQVRKLMVHNSRKKH